LNSAVSTRRWSFEPVIRHCVGTVAEFAFEAAVAAQAGKIARPRTGNDKSFRADLAILDDFPTGKHEGQPGVWQ
jgi:hypothetical protein